MTVLAKGVKVNVSGEEREIDILLNAEGNLVLAGIGSVIYEMYNDELVLMNPIDNT